MPAIENLCGHFYFLFVANSRDLLLESNFNREETNQDIKNNFLMFKILSSFYRVIN